MEELELTKSAESIIALTFFYVSDLYEMARLGIPHPDPHAGNMLVHTDRLVWSDFGVSSFITKSTSICTSENFCKRTQETFDLIVKYCKRKGIKHDYLEGIAEGIKDLDVSKPRLFYESLLERIERTLPAEVKKYLAREEHPTNKALSWRIGDLASDLKEQDERLKVQDERLKEQARDLKDLGEKLKELVDRNKGQDEGFKKKQDGQVALTNNSKADDKIHKEL